MTQCGGVKGNIFSFKYFYLSGCFLVKVLVAHHYTHTHTVQQQLLYKTPERNFVDNPFHEQH